MPSPSDSEPDAPEDDDDGQQPESAALTQTYLLTALHTTQLTDLLATTRSTASQRALLASLELETDKTLLKLLAVECREGGEDRGMRALELVRLMRDRSGRMLEAAGKVAERYGLGVLGGKIREVGEERVFGGADGGDGEESE
jgi:chromosome transmission fidelity protein 4